MAGVSLSVLVDADISRFSTALNNASRHADDFKIKIGDGGEKIRLGASQLKLLNGEASKKIPLPLDDSFKKFGQTVKENARVASESVAAFSMKTEDSRRSVSSLIKVFPQLSILRMAFHPVTLALAGLALVLGRVKKAYVELVEAQKPVVTTHFEESIESQNQAAAKYVRGLQDIGGAYEYVKRMRDEYMRGIKDESDFEIKLAGEKKERAIEEVKLAKAKGEITGPQAAAKIAEIEGKTAQDVADIKARAIAKEQEAIEGNLKALGDADMQDAERLKAAEDQANRYIERETIARKLKQKTEEMTAAEQATSLVPQAGFDGASVYVNNSIDNINLLKTEVADLQAQLLSLNASGKSIAPPVFDEVKDSVEKARIERSKARTESELQLKRIGTEQAQTFAIEYERQKAEDAKKQIELLTQQNEILKLINQNTRGSGKTLKLQ